MTIRNSIGLALAGLAAFSFSAQALQFQLDTPLDTKPSPSGNPPWLTVDIVGGQAANTVAITFKANLVASEKIDYVLLNFDPTLNVMDVLKPAPLSITGYSFIPVGLGNNGQPLPGDGDFDIKFNFENKTGEEFNGNDSVTLVLAALAGQTLTPDMFNFGSEQKGNPLFGYTAGAHVLALPNDGSTVIVSNGSVPEAASTALLLGIALVGLGSFRRSSSR